jgi:hypothetical protein
LGKLLGFAPTGYAGGKGLVGTGEALTTIAEMGTAVGFSDTKVKEGVGPVGVGKKDVTNVPLVLRKPVLAAVLLLDEDAEDATVAEEVAAEEGAAEEGVAAEAAAEAWRLKRVVAMSEN